MYVPTWSALSVPSSEFRTGRASTDIHVIVATGWPQHSLWLDYQYDGTRPHPMTRAEANAGWALHGGLPVSDDEVMFRGMDPIYVALPLLPIWPGFVIDALFYAAIWFGVFLGFTSAKRLIRIRRGRCPRCGYDLRGQRVEGEEVRDPAAAGELQSDVGHPHPSHLPEGEGVRAGCPECGWGRPD